jgi:heme/copper-type cytochrome/quinol oxidase subunit 3
VWLPFNYDQLTIYFDMTSSEEAEANAWFKQIQTYTACSIYLGWLFLLLQLVEYIYAQFAINDSIYGSLFYVMTGCHGFHVFVGVIYLSVSL